MTSVLDVLGCALAADVPIMLWSEPGRGKTAATTAMAEWAGAHLETLVGSTLDPVDIGGYLVPDAHSGIVRVSPPPWVRRIRAALDAGKPTWLLLDDYSCSPPSVRAGMLRTVQDRQCAEVDLTGCRIILASNPADSAADGGALDPATANRLAHVEWTVEAAAWVAGTLSGWSSPPLPTVAWRTKPTPAALAAAAALVAGYIRHKPSALHQLPESMAQRGLAWPSQRSWTAAMRMLAVAGNDAGLQRACVRACVGDGVAGEWAAWATSLDLPDPEEVLAGKAKLPKRGDQVAATLDAVVAAAMSTHPDRNARLAAAWAILSTCRPDISLSPAAALLAGGDDVPDVAVSLAARIRSVR